MILVPFLLAAVALGAEPAIDPQAVTYTDLPEDAGTYTPWADTPTTRETDPFAVDAVEEFQRRLAAWAPAQAQDPQATVEACLALLSLIDAARHPAECDAPALVLAHLRRRFAPAVLQAALARVALQPQRLMPLTHEPTFDVAYDAVEDLRERMVIYARKMLGRMRGVLPAR